MWMSEEQASQHQAWSLALAPWLLDEGSLTTKLCDHFADALRLDVYVDGWGVQPSAVDLCLGVATEPVWLREVAWVEKTRWLLARTVIPKDTMSGPGAALLSVDRTPLGHVLFADRSLSRTVTFCYLVQGDPLHDWVCGYEPRLAHQSLWARTSLFLYHRRPLVLQEVFLPDGVARLLKVTE